MGKIAWVNDQTFLTDFKTSILCCTSDGFLAPKDSSRSLIRRLEIEAVMAASSTYSIASKIRLR